MKISEGLPVFLNQNKDKHIILSIENNELRFVNLNEGSCCAKILRFFKRIQAWFGYGSYSLKNIVTFIEKNEATISRSLFEVIDEQTIKNRYNFSLLCSKFKKNISSFNKKHYFNCQKISEATASCFDTNWKFGVAKTGGCDMNATYVSNDDTNILDFAFTEYRLGFGFVLDGTGHNDFEKYKILRPIVIQLIRNYLEMFPNPYFDTIEKAALKIREILEISAQSFRRLEDPSQHPAFSLAQIVIVNGQRILLTVEKADTAIIIKKADGTFNTDLIARRGPNGLGTGELIVVQTPLEEDDLVIGFSDGIGEFLTMEEVQGCINSSENPLHLLSTFKEKIIEKGQQFVETTPFVRTERRETANKMKNMKYHLETEKTLTDDISMFYLQVR